MTRCTWRPLRRPAVRFCCPQMTDLSNALREETVNPGFQCEIRYHGSRSKVLTAFEKMTDEQFERHAFDLLRRELGLAGLARFLRLHRSGPGDYAHDRDAWQRGLTVEQVAADIRRRNR